MSRPMSVHEVKCKRTAEKYTLEKGGQVIEGGEHTLGVGPRGKVAFPRHRGEYPKGLAHAIRKKLIAIGLVVLAFVASLTIFWIM